MRKEYGRELRLQFASAMRELAPEFEEHREKTRYLWPGERAFSWSAPRGLGFVVLSPDAKGDDKFTVEVGWSRLRRFPQLPVRVGDPRDTSGNEEFLCRLGQLVDGKDRWWTLRGDLPLTVEELAEAMKPIASEQAAATVRPLVADAIALLRDHGLPFVREHLR